MISDAEHNFHWNYFVALEKDLEIVSRYIEFCSANFSVFSIELAHLLLGATAEVDVLANSVCKKLALRKRHSNILDYQKTLTEEMREIARMRVHVPRYGLEFAPWDKWISA